MLKIFANVDNSEITVINVSYFYQTAYIIVR